MPERIHGGHDRSNVSVLVAGCGSIGRRHIQNALSLNVGRVFAFDASETQRKSLRNESDICVLDNLADALRLSPTAVVVATPTDQHVAVALEAARHGCHLLIEKPVSHSLGDIDRLCAEIERRGLVSMTACNMRFHPGPATVKQLIDVRTIGRVLASQDYRQSYSASRQWGGAALDCIHEIDLALWYFGSAELVASASLPADTIGLQVDGLTEMILLHHTGVLSSVHLNFVQQDYRRACEIIGSLGTIYWDFSLGHVRVVGADGVATKQFEQPAGWKINQMYVDELDHFFSCIAEQRSTINPVRASLESLRIALTVRASMAKRVA